MAGIFIYAAGCIRSIKKNIKTESLKIKMLYLQWWEVNPLEIRLVLVCAHTHTYTHLFHRFSQCCKHLSNWSVRITRIVMLCSVVFISLLIFRLSNLFLCLETRKRPVSHIWWEGRLPHLFNKIATQARLSRQVHCYGEFATHQISASVAIYNYCITEASQHL
jgi:hypothetical protein